MEIYCNGKRNEIVDYLNPVAKGVVEEVVRKAKKKIKHFYRLDIEIKGSQVIVTIHGKSNLKMRFNYSVEGTMVSTKLPPANVILNRLPPANLEEEIMEALYSCCPNPIAGPHIDDKFVDEKNGIAVFIVWEVLKERPLKNPTSCQKRLHEENNYYRFSLIHICKGRGPKILFSDEAWSEERACWIKDLKIEHKTIEVKHFITKRPFSMEGKKEFEELTFDLYDC